MNGAMVASDFASIVGPERVVEDPARIPTVDGLRPHILVVPAEVGQVAELLQLAAKRKLAVIPVGGGTLLHVGNLPSRADVALSLRDLGRVVDYEVGDFTVVVEAGVTLRALRELTASHRQVPPIDAPREEDATLGGLLAAGISGVFRPHFGPLRDQVLETRVAHTDGTITKAGGRVVKNVTGYDLNKLYVGSLGTLGVIVETCLRLRPAPESRATLAIAFEDLKGAHQYASLMRRGGMTPSGFVLLDGVLKTLAELTTAAGEGSVLGICSFMGRTEEVDDLLARAQTFLPKGAVRGVCAIRGVAEEALWTEVRQRGVEEHDYTHVKLMALPSRLYDVLAAAGQAAQQQDCAGHYVAHPVEGLCRIVLRTGNEAGSFFGFLDRLRRALQKIGGRWTIERAPREIKENLDIMGDLPEGFELMRALRRAFDPTGTVNPGRFVGRL